MDIEIEAGEFPGCCGIDVINSFPFDGNIEDEVKRVQDEEEMDDDYDTPPKSVDQAKKLIRSYMSNEFGKGQPLKLAALTHQQKIAQDVLLEDGYQAIGTFQGNSKATITLFAKGLKPLATVAAASTKRTRKSPAKKARRGR